MGRIIVIVLGLAVIGGGGAYFFMPGVKNKVDEAARTASGYGPAEKPIECADRFREAIKARKYKVAADVYLTGSYADYMRKGAEAAESLGKTIDDLLYQMKNKDYDSDKIQALMSYLEPFPTDLQGVVKNETKDKALFVFTNSRVFAFKPMDINYFQGAVDGRIIRALSADLPLEVDMVKTGDGDKKSWRFSFPATPAVQLKTDWLCQKYKTYVKALDAVKYSVTNERLPKADLEEKVRSELQKCAND